MSAVALTPRLRRAAAQAALRTGADPQGPWNERAHLRWPSRLSCGS